MYPAHPNADQEDAHPAPASRTVSKAEPPLGGVPHVFRASDPPSGVPAPRSSKERNVEPGGIVALSPVPLQS